jgi:hypothetical protein
MSLTHTVRPTHAPTSKPSSPRPKLKVPWLLAAGGVFVLSVMLVLWAVSSASDRTQVLMVLERQRLRADLSRIATRRHRGRCRCW